MNLKQTEDKRACPDTPTNRATWFHVILLKYFVFLLQTASLKRGRLSIAQSTLRTNRIAISQVSMSYPSSLCGPLCEELLATETVHCEVQNVLGDKTNSFK